jgi:hypothetical protein
MNSPSPIVRAQTEALLRRVAADRDARVQETRRNGDQAAHELLAQARRDARSRVLAAVAEERQLHTRALADRRAALDTEERQRVQALLGGLVARAWASLPMALEGRWTDADGARRWCLAAGAQARAVLPSDVESVVEVDVTCAAARQALVLASLRRAGWAAERVSPVHGLGAGLRLRAGAACVDATIAGLLHARDQVEAALLAAIETQLARQQQDRR